MVDLLSHIETTRISKFQPTKFNSIFDHPGHFDYFSSNACPHYNDHLMVISTKTFAVQNNPWWLNRSCVPARHSDCIAWFYYYT